MGGFTEEVPFDPHWGFGGLLWVRVGLSRALEA